MVHRHCNLPGYSWEMVKRNRKQILTKNTMFFGENKPVQAMAWPMLHQENPRNSGPCTHEWVKQDDWHPKQAGTTGWRNVPEKVAATCALVRHHHEWRSEPVTAITGRTLEGVLGWSLGLKHSSSSAAGYRLVALVGIYLGNISQFPPSSSVNRLPAQNRHGKAVWLIWSTLILLKTLKRYIPRKGSNCPFLDGNLQHIQTGYLFEPE